MTHKTALSRTNVSFSVSCGMHSVCGLCAVCVPLCMCRVYILQACSSHFSHEVQIYFYELGMIWFEDRLIPLHPSVLGVPGLWGSHPDPCYRSETSTSSSYARTA